MEQQEREIRGLAEAEHMARDVAESHWVRKACYSLKNVTCCQGLRVQFSGKSCMLSKTDECISWGW